MLKDYPFLKAKWHIPFQFGIIMLILLVFLIPGRALSQDSKLIRGTVSEANGLPLQGVSVTIKSTQRGTTTDRDGKYSIQAKSTDMLVYSYIDLKNQETLVGSRTVINVSLASTTSLLQDVVVIGYASVKKVDLTGSVSVVNIKDLSKAPVASFADALAGRVAGVQVGSIDGQPGAVSNITIRGPGSLTQSVSPLYVIDGFPIENLDPATINPEEIESMSILKDASSTAIYGSRAANGVILIQTKRGKAGKLIISYSSSVGYQMTPRQIELMSPYEYIKYQKELSPNVASTTAFFANGKTLEDYRNVKGVNFQDFILHTGSVQIHNLALRGGNDQTRYSVSGSIYDQKGVIINTGYKRYSGRVTLDQTISSKIKTGVTFDYSYGESFGQVINQVSATNGGLVNNANPNAYVLARAWLYRPITPKLTDDLLNDPVDQDALGQFDVRVNPFVDLLNQYDFTRTNIYEGNAFISYDITKDLTFKSQGVFRRNTVGRELFNNSKTAAGSPNIFNPFGVNGLILNLSTNYVYNSNTLNYKKTFNTDHTITGLGLFEVSSVKLSRNGYSGKFLPNEYLGIDGLDEGAPYNLIASNSKNTLVSFATRWDYNYKSKYIVTGTFRADGSSKFKNNRWGYFPGASVAWNMHKEGFFAKAFPVISTSKLTVGYGSIGNNRVGDFDYSPSLLQTLDGYSFNNAGSAGAIYVSNIGNPDLKWETSTTLDLSYEIGILKDRISLEFAVYRKTTKDLLLNAQLPPTTGFSTAFKNIGSLRNEGVEFTLNTTNISTKSFTWRSNFNISFNKNEVIALTNGQQSLASISLYFNQFVNPLYLAQIGKPSGMMMGYIWDGNYQYADFDNPSPGVYILKPSVSTNGAVRSTIQPGDIKYKDLNGDGVMSIADITFIGRGQPIHTGGFSNNFSYKGFDLNVFFQWSYGNNIYNANRLLLEGNSNNGVNINQYASYVNRWSPDNQTNANYRAGGIGPIGFHSSRVVEDGSYLRLKTVALSYTIPPRYIKKAYLNDLSFFVSAQNLVTWTKYSGLDPDVSARNNVLTPGFDYSSYPKSPTIVFGLKAAF